MKVVYVVRFCNIVSSILSRLLEMLYSLTCKASLKEIGFTPSQLFLPIYVYVMLNFSAMARKKQWWEGYLEEKKQYLS